MTSNNSDIPISFVVAVARNGVIGRDGDLPWRISSDLKLFRKLTLGKPVVMGRSTFDSIGKPLDGRTNIIVTRDASRTIDGAIVVTDLQTALEKARQSVEEEDPEIMVIGGAQIYSALMDQVDRLYVTEVQLEAHGDAGFPPIDAAVWQEVERTPYPKGDKDDASFDFVVYLRRTPQV